MTHPADRPGTALLVIDAQNGVLAGAHQRDPVVANIGALVDRAFEATDLEQVLAGADIGHLVVVGAQTGACVRSTLHGGFARGYDATLVSHAHTTEDLTEWGVPPPAQVIAHTNAHTNLYWSFQIAPGRTGRVVPTAGVEFTRRAAQAGSQ
ncbi:MAG: isochorismatase family protein [Microbacteriaceae bacterium]